MLTTAMQSEQLVEAVVPPLLKVMPLPALLAPLVAGSKAASFTGTQESTPGVRLWEEALLLLLLLLLEEEEEEEGEEAAKDSSAEEEGPLADAGTAAAAEQAASESAPSSGLRCRHSSRWRVSRGALSSLSSL